jgi:hypothetical protein
MPEPKSRKATNYLILAENHPIVTHAPGSSQMHTGRRGLSIDLDLERSGRIDPSAGPRDPRGFLEGVFPLNAVFADGSVHFLNKNLDIRNFARLVTYAGGEIVSADGN